MQDPNELYMEYCVYNCIDNPISIKAQGNEYCMIVLGLTTVLKNMSLHHL